MFKQTANKQMADKQTAKADTYYKSWVQTGLLALTLASVLFIFVAPVAAASPLAPHLDLLGGLQEFLIGFARIAAVIGLLLFGISMLLPANIFQTIGLNIPQDYLTKLAIGILIIVSAAMIVDTLFALGGG